MAKNLNGVIAAYDAYTKGLDLASDVATVLDNKLRENAQAEARTAQLQYQQDAADFMTKLENSNDFGNWQNKANEFLTNYSNKLQSSAKNGYTAILFKEQMDQNAAQMNINLINAVNRGMNKEYDVETQKSLELVKDQYTGQERLDKSMEILNERYERGIDDRAAYENKSREICMNASIDDYMSQSSSMVDNAVMSGKSEAWLNEQLNTMKDNELWYTTKGGKPQKLTTEEREKLRESVRKQSQSQYKIKVQEMQTANANKLTDIVQQINNYPTGDPNAEWLKSQGRTMLKNMMNNNALALDKGDRISFSEKFKPHKAAEEGSGSGSARIGRYENECVKQLKRELDNAKLGLNSAKKGYETGYAVMDRVNDICDSIIGDGNLSQDQKDELYSYVYVQGIEYITAEWPKTEAVSNVKQKCEKYLAEIKHPEYKAELLARLVDYSADVDISNLNQDELVKYMNGIMGSICLKDMNATQLDKYGKAKLKEKDVAKAFAQIRDNKLVYTNPKGATVYDKGVEENLKVIDEHFTNYLEAYGLEKANLTPTWESDGKHDLSGNRVYLDSSTGYKYKFTPTADGKSFTMSISKDNGYGRQITEKEMEAQKKTLGAKVRAENDKKREDIKKQYAEIDKVQTANRVAKWNEQKVNDVIKDDYASMPQPFKELVSEKDWKYASPERRKQLIKENAELQDYIFNAMQR